MRIPAVFLVTLLALGCNERQQATIPNGQYVSTTSNNMIEVSGHEMKLLISLIGKDGKMEPEAYEYEYEYARFEDRILLRGMRSAEAIYGIGQFVWIWDGNEIQQVHRKSEKTVQFFRRVGT